MTSAIPAPCDSAVRDDVASRPDAHPAATLAVTILGSSVAFIDGSVVNVALPTLARDLNASAGELSWTINAYLLPLGALLLLGGGAGDRFGRRRLFLIGLSLFTLGSVLCALAPDVPLLLAGRALQGVGAALLMPNSLALLAAAFQGEARGRAIGTWAATGALAGAIGPLIGGWLIDAVNWRAIFLLNLPIAAVAAYLANRFVSESKAGTGAALDWAGALAATVALASLTWALTAAAEGGSRQMLMSVGAAVGVAALAAFVWIEHKRGDEAMIPLAMFGQSTFVGLTLLTFLLYASLGGLLVLLPFFLIRIENYSAVAAGAALLPVPIVIGLGSPLMGGLAARFGGRVLLGLGSALVACGMALYAGADGRHVDYWTDILPATVLVALGMALCVAPLTTMVMASVDAGHIGAASGFNSAVARVAGLIATALLGFVFAAQASVTEFTAGFRIAALAGAALAGAAALCAVLMIRDVPQQPRSASP